MSTLTYKNRIFLVLFILAVGIVADQVTKAVASSYLASSSPVYFIGRMIRLEYFENTGAFLSYGWRMPEEVRFWAFNVLTGAALFAVLIFILLKPALSKLSTIALSCIVAGGTSNIIDRQLHQGAVIDFISLGVFGIHTWIFNLADVMITIGVGLLLIHWIRSLGTNRT